MARPPTATAATDATVARSGPAPAGAADAGLFGPGSVTWRVHADPAMLVGGLRALLVQAVHPLAMAGVADHSDYRTDPWGRLQRTADYVTTTTFGTTEQAHAAGARVRAVHLRVCGVDAVTGRAYRADDPELLAWVHNVEVHSFLTAYRRYGGRLSDADADRYVAEMGRVAELVGLARGDVPADLAGLRRYLRGVEGLVVTPAAREGLRVLMAPPMPLAARPLWGLPVTAAVALLPRRVRALYGLPWFSPATPAVRVGVFALCRALNVALGPSPPARAAHARVAGAGA